MYGVVASLVFGFVVAEEAVRTADIVPAVAQMDCVTDSLAFVLEAGVQGALQCSNCVSRSASLRYSRLKYMYARLAAPHFSICPKGEVTRVALAFREAYHRLIQLS